MTEEKNYTNFETKIHSNKERKLNLTTEIKT